MFSIVRVRKLLAEITNNAIEETKEFIRATFIMEIKNIVMQIKQRFKTKVLINFTTWSRLCNTGD